MPDTNTLRTLIAQNKIEQALDLLKKDTIADNDLQTQVAMLSAKWSDTRRKERLGLADTRDIGVAYNQVNGGLLDLIGTIESTAPVVKKVFISYNHADAEVAESLQKKLEAKGISVLIDSKMQAGDDIKEFIESCVRDSDVTLSVVSKNSLYSAWVAMESIGTFFSEKETGGKKFIACYTEDGITNDDFTDKALEDLKQKKADREERFRQRMAKVPPDPTYDLQDELERVTDLVNNYTKIIRRLKASLRIDIRNGIPDESLNKIVEAIQQ